MLDKLFSMFIVGIVFLVCGGCIVKAVALENIHMKKI